MKIVEIIHTLNIGGAEILLLNLCKGLKKLNPQIEISVIVLSNSTPLESGFNDIDVPITKIDISQLSFFQRFSTLKNKLKEINPDIVHTHLLMADRYGLVAAKLAKVPVRIATAHNMEPKRSLQDKLTRVLTSIFAQRIIAVSHSAKEFYIKNHIYPKKKLHVVYNAPGFESDNVKPLQQEHFKKQKISLIAVGKLSIQKGHIYLLEAMNKLNGINIELTIWGSEADSYSQTLRDKLTELNLTNVHINGPTSDVKLKLECADLFIAPSLWEAFNMALMEAITMGVPVIATDIPPHIELLTKVKKDYPLFINSKSSESIVEKLQLAISKPELLEELSQRNLEAAKEFSISQMVRNYLRHYEAQPNE